METSDEVLVGRALGGDGAAFSSLVERHYDRIYRLAYIQLGNRADAQDLAQDVCAALAGKLGGFRREARFTSWLYRIVVNAAHDRRRRGATRAKAAEGWGETEVLSRAADAQTRAEIAWLHDAMQALPADLRDTLALVLGEDMNHREAAGALGISEGTVSWRMSEIRKRLRQMARSEEDRP